MIERILRTLNILSHLIIFLTKRALSTIINDILIRWALVIIIIVTIIKKTFFTVDHLVCLRCLDCLIRYISGKMIIYSMRSIYWRGLNIRLLIIRYMVVVIIRVLVNEIMLLLILLRLFNARCLMKRLFRIWMRINWVGWLSRRSSSSSSHYRRIWRVSLSEKICSLLIWRRYMRLGLIINSRQWIRKGGKFKEGRRRTIILVIGLIVYLSR